MISKCFILLFSVKLCCYHMTCPFESTPASSSPPCAKERHPKHTHSRVLRHHGHGARHGVRRPLLSTYPPRVSLVRGLSACHASNISCECLRTSFRNTVHIAYVRIGLQTSGASWNTSLFVQETAY